MDKSESALIWFCSVWAGLQNIRSQKSKASLQIGSMGFPSNPREQVLIFCSRKWFKTFSRLLTMEQCEKSRSQEGKPFCWKPSPYIVFLKVEPASESL